MMKRWNVMGKMMVCSLAAAVMVMVGTEFGLTARAEMLIDSEGDVQEVQEAVQEMAQEPTEEIAQEMAQEIVPESEDMGVLQEEAPAAEEMPAAGDLVVDGMELVVIEEDLVPGAALPDLEAAFTEGEAEAEETQEEEAGAEASEEEEVPAESAETSVSGTLTYEDSEVAVTVIATEAAQLPADTEVKVTKLEEGSAEYEAAKEAARQGLEAGENASYTFYDVTLESEGQALYVEEGTVSVRMEFKTAETCEKKDVVSIEETESGKVARNVTDTTNENAGSVAISY